MTQTLPVPIEPQPERKPQGRRQASAAYAAQLLGQEGIRRGLRAGPQAVEAAQGAYRDREFSGSADRRLPSGAIARATA